MPKTGASGVDYSVVQDRQIDDARFERQRSAREQKQPPAGAQSATMDAIMRIMTGKEERTIADRISDPNRLTWDQYKKENADKLRMEGNDEHERLQYRKELDAARDKALAKRGRKDDSDDDRKKRKRKSKKKSSKSKKSKRKRKYRSSSDDSSDSDDSRRPSKKKKKKKSSRSSSPVRLSSFFQRGSDSDSD